MIEALESEAGPNPALKEAVKKYREAIERDDLITTALNVPPAAEGPIKLPVKINWANGASRYHRIVDAEGTLIVDRYELMENAVSFVKQIAAALNAQPTAGECGVYLGDVGPDRMHCDLAAGHEKHSAACGTSGLRYAPPQLPAGGGGDLPDEERARK